MSDLRLYPFSFTPISSAPIRKWGFSAALIGAIVISSLFVFASPVLAHHPLGGKIPANLFEGFMSGLAHPVLGPDHFAFVVAVGLLAAIKLQGIYIPVAFVLTGLAGAGIHLMNLDLPAPELCIAVSVLLFGFMLSMQNSPDIKLIIGLAAIAGLFHGYAYGETIIEAEMTPLAAYLTGFTVIQLAIAYLAFQVGKSVLQSSTEHPLLTLRFAGFTLCGAGMAFLTSLMLD